jgi:predicted tellurium resistance membrane protein TerC
LQLIGSVLLLWIGVKLLAAEEEAEEGSVKQSNNFWEAVRIIIIADIVMSLDNVLGMAAVAKGHLWMLFVGMVITIPLILFCSAMIMKLMERFPILIIIGAGLLGYVAGDMAVDDPAVKHIIEANASFLTILVPVIGAIFVIVVGTLLARKHRAAQAAEADTAAVADQTPAQSS